MDLFSSVYREDMLTGWCMAPSKQIPLQSSSLISSATDSDTHIFILSYDIFQPAPSRVIHSTHACETHPSPLLSSPQQTRARAFPRFTEIPASRWTGNPDVACGLQHELHNISIFLVNGVLCSYTAVGGVLIDRIGRGVGD